MIWNFTDYRPYLVKKLGPEGSRTGLRKKLAEAIGVHTTFVSQVLKEKSDFSLEQGEAINGFLSHTNDEGEYFLLLLLKGRAGTRELRKRFLDKIEIQRKERLSIKKRLETKTEISAHDRERFYSNVYYGTIHVLTSIPEFRHVEKIAEALKLPREQVQDMVDFMLKLGILLEKEGNLVSGSQHMHLGNDSATILKHHTNWRLQTLQNLRFVHPENIHYSACLSLSREDAFRIKELLLSELKNHLKIVERSAEEIAYVYTFDFYPLLEK
ncbi:MAG: DUF4423 domain-containing protein [Bdellovibrio sp.]